jgi:hypothetical protein
VLDYKDPRNRTPDVVPSHRILLAKLLVDQNAYNEHDLMLWIIEEEVRRAMRAAYGADDDVTLLNMLAERFGCDKLVSIAPGKPDSLHKLANEKKYFDLQFDVETQSKSLEAMLNRKVGKSLPQLLRFFALYRATHGQLLTKAQFCNQIDLHGGIPTDE